MGLVLNQRSNITGTLRNKIQVKEKKSEHGDWQLLKDRITRGHRYYCTLAQCVIYQITKTRYTWVVPWSPDPCYLPGVKRSPVLTNPPVHCSNGNTGKIVFKSDIYSLIMDASIYSLPLLSPQKFICKKTHLNNFNILYMVILSDELTTLFSLMNQKPCFRSKSFNRYLKV